MPSEPVDNGILKNNEEIITPRRPANVELMTNQRITDDANLPANPRLTRAANAGLRAAKIKRGTIETTNFIKDEVPAAIGADTPGKSPPKVIPVMRARRVQA